MQITINFPDDIGKQIQQLPDMDSTLVKQALENRRSEGNSEEHGRSRWPAFQSEYAKTPL
ncbi:hypothetical protein QUF80_16910 [Desulfococcaceae bacterium HSG8]|nr:hypothetical protein [Desulfococcaceae bacterium HSG8]